MKEVKVELISPPSLFWKIITTEQWQKMSDKDRNVLVSAAKILHHFYDYSKVFTV